MIEVELPDGQIAEFPDSMTPEQIQEVLSRQFPSGEQAPPEVSQASSRLGRRRASRQDAVDKREASLARTAESNPMLADEIRNMGAGQSALIGAGGGFKELLAGAGLVDISDEERQSFNALVDANPSAGIGRVLGQAGPFAGIGGVAAGLQRGVAMPIRAATQSAIGATEGGLVAKGTGGDLGKIVAGATLGGLVGGAAEVIGPLVRRAASSLVQRVKGAPPKGKVLDDAGRPTPELQQALDESGQSFDDIVKEAQRQAPKELTQEVVKGGRTDSLGAAALVEADPARVAAARRLDLEEDAPIGVLTKDRAAQELTGSLAAIPNSRASEALDTFSEKLGQRADDYVERLGGSADRGAVDQNFFDSMQSDISRIRAVEDKLYARIRGAIGEGAPVDAQPIKNVLAARGRTRRGIKNLSKVERDVYKRVQDGEVTYAELDDMISDIGAALGKQTDAYSTVQKSKLSDMYGKLSTLREGVAETFGQKQNLQRAKEVGASRFGLQEITENFFGKDLQKSIFPKIDKVIKGLDRGSVREFEATMEIVPAKYRKPIAATMLNTALTGGRNQALGVNSGQFAKWYGNLERNQSAMNSLRKYVGDEGMDRFSDIAELAKGVAGVTKSRIRTGVQSEVMKRLDDIGGITGKLFSVAQKVDVTPGLGVVAKPITGVANMAKAFTLEKTPAVEAADTLLSSKAFKDAVINARRGGIDSPRYKAAAAALKKTPAYKKYIRELDQSAVSAITATGLIPWLASTDEEDTDA